MQWLTSGRRKKDTTWTARGVHIIFREGFCAQFHCHTLARLSACNNSAYYHWVTTTTCSDRSSLVLVWMRDAPLIRSPVERVWWYRVSDKWQNNREECGCRIIPCFLFAHIKYLFNINRLKFRSSINLQISFFIIKIQTEKFSTGLPTPNIISLNGVIIFYQWSSMDFDQFD